MASVQCINDVNVLMRGFTERSLHGFWARIDGAVVLRDKTKWAMGRAVGLYSASSASMGIQADFFAVQTQQVNNVCTNTQVKILTLQPLDEHPQPPSLAWALLYRA